MQSNYDAIYLSPHLDDAALSCGAQIFDRTHAGQRVLIVTIMAGSPRLDIRSAYIERLHERWELAGDAAAARREEDIEASRILGAGFLHMEVPDCIDRLDPATGEPLYISDADIFGDLHPAETELAMQLAAQFRSLPSATSRYAPLTVGHHVDHLLVRAAAEQVWSGELAYYEDYPYVQQPEKLARVIGEDASWRATAIPVSDAALATKFDAIWAFRSQLSTFFGSREDMEEQVGRYMRSVGGEQNWERF
ncbi:MAG: PIG-L family deacetylase [Anaerolineales bacterium]|nr:PIG-L family deacetylase [Anaerolineales bacterium]